MGEVLATEVLKKGEEMMSEHRGFIASNKKIVTEWCAATAAARPPARPPAHMFFFFFYSINLTLRVTVCRVDNHEHIEWVYPAVGVVGFPR